MIVYEMGEYCEIDGDVYEVVESGWNPDKEKTWTMVLRPCDGRLHLLQVHDTEPVMRFGAELPALPSVTARSARKRPRVLTAGHHGGAAA